MMSEGDSTNSVLENIFRMKLLKIDAQLEEEEVEHLKFLCQGFVSMKKLENCKSALNIFDHLLAEECLSEEDPFFLAELLYTIKQFLLLRHLDYSKEQVERFLPTRRRISLFRTLLYELSEDIDPENLQEMVFILKDMIPKAPKNSLSFLAYLEKQARIDEDNLNLLVDLFQNTKPILVRKIEKYKKEKANQVVTSPVKESKSLYQGEEELFSPSEIKRFSEALLEADVYRMDGIFRGYCVIVNNEIFTSRDRRWGTGVDAELLSHVFDWLGFTIDRRNNVNKEGLEKILKKYQHHPDHAKGDCFVFCVLTHGDCGRVCTSDESLVGIEEIMSHFTLQQCPDLAGKPKLFFIQACQGKEKQPSVSIEADAINPEQLNPEPLSLQKYLPDWVDMLIGLSTVPGCVSYRDVHKGSWYIQSLCRCLQNMVPRHHDILTILTAVNKDVSEKEDSQLPGTKKQIPQPSFTLRKKLIFPVPPQSRE